MRADLAPTFRLLRSAAAWALATSATTAGLSATGRALCLPPYWPAEVVFRCRPKGVGEALVRLPLDAFLTTLLLFVPALVAGAAIHLIVTVLRAGGRSGTARLVGAVAGAVAWIWLALRLEPSYLDFILGGYAIAAGALAGAAVGGWWMTGAT